MLFFGFIIFYFLFFLMCIRRWSLEVPSDFSFLRPLLQGYLGSPPIVSIAEVPATCRERVGRVKWVTRGMAKEVESV